ncbi:uncharacterized protein C15orf62 homolog, mitochondrial [Pogona vitticeps]
MDTWRRGSIRSPGFFKRLSFRRNKKLGSQVIILNHNSQTLDTSGQYHKKELLRDLKGKSDYLSCQSEQNLAAKPPPKPPRLYLDSTSCPNIIDHTDSPSPELSFPNASHQSHKATQTPPDLFCKNQALNWDPADTTSWHGKPLPDPSDPFLSFKLDFGPSLLDDILQALGKQNLLLN